MNWKNVLSLMQVERKSGRLLRGRKITHFRENRFLAYWPYWVALAVGLVAGILAGVGSSFALAADPKISDSFYQGALNVFSSLPTLVLIYGLVFTLFQQIQRLGVRASSQVPYWLPVTWQEHTIASILASLLGFPLASLVAIASALIPFSLFVGLVPPAVLAVLAVCAAAFMASATTEVLRILQVRFIGAVYKSTGRAAIWVRFIGSLMFFMVFYAVYFYVTSGSGAITFIQTISSTQSAIWFVPFVWLGLTIYAFTVSGLLLQGSIFLILSILFIAGLFFFATLLNRRFGLYEPPAITVSRGTYMPRTGLLGKFGFSTAEAAMIRKDVKAFTRRRELMTVFIVPIIVILVPLMQSFSQTNQAMPPGFTISMTALTFLLPPSVLAMSSGNFMIGEEGQAVWRIYSAPISARSLVKSKYIFIVFFSLIILVITGILGVFFFHPSLRTVIVALIEAVFLVFALGAISFSNGISGADFIEVPRSRMVRTTTAWLNIAACLLAGMAILAPFFPYMLSVFVPNLFGFFVDPYQAVIISAIIAVILTIIFYRVALKNAKELLAKAEI